MSRTLCLYRVRKAMGPLSLHSSRLRRRATAPHRRCAGKPGKYVHYKGLRNLDATIDYAFAHLGLEKATEMVVTGQRKPQRPAAHPPPVQRRRHAHRSTAPTALHLSAGGSAGGLSTFLHVDRIAARMQKGAPSRQRDCHFDDTPFLCLLKHLLQVEGGAAE